MARSQSWSIAMTGNDRGVDDATVLWLQQLAVTLRRHGLATPAIMLLDGLGPFAEIGEHAVLALRPLLPVRLRGRAETVADLVRDPAQRALLTQLLSE